MVFMADRSLSALLLLVVAPPCLHALTSGVLGVYLLRIMSLICLIKAASPCAGSSCRQSW